MTFSPRYKSPIRCALIWMAFGLLVPNRPRYGNSLRAFVHALVGFAVLLLLVTLRRPNTPTSLDLLLVGWSLPILFFTLLLNPFE